MAYSSTTPTAHVRSNLYHDADPFNNPQGDASGDYHASVSIFRTYITGPEDTKVVVLDHIADIRAALAACQDAIDHHEAMEASRK
jgi:hypothetical protein